MNSDMPEAGKMPYGIPESAYVEITDKQFSADVDKCKFLGYDNAPRGFVLHEFIDVKVNGKPVTNFKTDGSELDLRFDGQFTEDPDGPGVGLDDIDGDGFYDDLPSLDRKSVV